jgi:hypothetical protein
MARQLIGGEMMQYIASCSFGKDSLAMVLLLIAKNEPLDEVVFYNTGMEFEAIYHIRDKLIPILEENEIKYVELKPDRPFLYDMLEKPIYSKKNGHHNGYGWCGGACRWGTQFKNDVIDRYKNSLNDELYEYIGIAADEQDRIKNMHYPLVEWGMTEKNCLDYCRENGWQWLEMENGQAIDLYDVLDRVSCWCCSNKNLKELNAIHRHLPSYWDRLKDLQRQIENL